MPVEQTSVFRPTMEANLRSLVAAAHCERQLDRRMTLLALANRAAELLVTIIGRTSDDERRPWPRSDSSEWKAMVGQLRDLFRDERAALVHEEHTDLIVTPAEKSAEVVWTLWQPNTRRLDPGKRDAQPDWRSNELRTYDGPGRSLIVEAAQDCLANPAGFEAQSYPEQKAAELASQLSRGTAVEWRKLLSALPWNERLLAQTATRSDREFAVRLWPRLLEFNDWQAAEPERSPATFDALWRAKLAGKSLDEAAWRALQEWIVSEARAGRSWWIVGETFPTRPGIRLYILQTPAEFTSDDEFPALKARLDGDFDLRSQPEHYRVLPTALKAVPPQPDEFGPPDEKLPTPIEAIHLQSRRKADDLDLNREGFRLHVLALPPKK